MDERANQSERGPLTIKNFSVETRKLAVAHAANRGESMAEWVARAIQTQAALESRDAILPPAESVPALIASPRPAASDPAGLVRLAVEWSRADQAQLPRALVDQVDRLLRDEVRAARGLKTRGRSAPVLTIVGG